MSGATSLEPEIGFHPYRAVYRLPFVVYTGGTWTEDRPGAETGHAGLDALMALPGVTVVSLNEDLVSLVRDPATPWDALLEPVRAILEAEFVGPRKAFVAP
jgi:hypothetical protein